MQFERALVLIDGSNFYFKLRDLKLHQLLTFNFSHFAKTITGNRRLISATYYVGKVRTDGTARTQELFNNQRKLLAYLRKHQFTYSLGYLLNQMENSMKKALTCKLPLICWLQPMITFVSAFIS